MPAPEIGVVRWQGLGVHASGGHQDHPRRSRRGAGGEDGQQQFRHQQGSQDVSGHGEFVAVHALGALARHHPGVVDEDVETAPLAGEALAQVGGEAAYGVEVRDVAGLGDRTPTRAAVVDLGIEPIGRGPDALGAATQHVHLRPQLKEAACRGQAQARCRPGDEGTLSRQGAGTRVRTPAAPTDPMADGGVAGHDRAVEEAIEKAFPRGGGWIHACSFGVAHEALITVRGAR